MNVGNLGTYLKRLKMFQEKVIKMIFQKNVNIVLVYSKMTEECVLKTIFLMIGPPLFLCLRTSV